MKSANKIRYCSYKEIDKNKWDRCIEEAANGLLYAQSSFLDFMCASWDALVLDDYEAVMPLVWNRKYGFSYLYQPYFISALGVFGNSSAVSIQDFLNAVPAKFRYLDVDLNETNTLPVTDNPLTVDTRRRTNYLLRLDRHYDIITAGYKRLCRRMIQRARLQEINIFCDGTPKDVIEFYRRHYSQKHLQITPAAYGRLLACTNRYFRKGMVKIYIAKSQAGEILGAYLILVDQKFVYSLLGGTTAEGKQAGAFYLLTDAAIKEHAGTARVFRFEGSDIKGVAFFNAQFGPDLIHYLRISRNALPFPFNLFK